MRGDKEDTRRKWLLLSSHVPIVSADDTLEGCIQATLTTFPRRNTFITLFQRPET